MENNRIIDTVRGWFNRKPISKEVPKYWTPEERNAYVDRMQQIARDHFKNTLGEDSYEYWKKHSGTYHDNPKYNQDSLRSFTDWYNYNEMPLWDYSTKIPVNAQGGQLPRLKRK